MEILREFSVAALYILGICWICNIMTLFAKPHKWCELLIFLQLVWFVFGVICIERFRPQSETEWYLVIYGYPVLLLLIHVFTCCRFFSLYKMQKQENEKFLYLAISQIVSAIVLPFLWISGIYALLHSLAV